jgi:hypothetical protein
MNGYKPKKNIVYDIYAQKPIKDLSFNDQKITKTQPNGIIVYIFGFSVDGSTKKFNID